MTYSDDPRRPLPPPGPTVPSGRPGGPGGPGGGPGTRSGHLTVDAGRLWAGGAATALVASLVALVGLLVTRGVLDIPVLAPRSEGTLGDDAWERYVSAAVLASILATGLMHLLIVSTPRPLTFFTWIGSLATVAAALAPFLRGADLEPTVSAAVINLLIGISIITLLRSVAGRTMMWVAD
jgi:hypothetical protein